MFCLHCSESATMDYVRSTHLRAITTLLIVLTMSASGRQAAAELHIERPSVTGRQFNGDNCTSDSDCAAPRTCMDINARAGCAGADGCVCAALSNIVCEDSSDCLNMDRCYATESEGSICLSCSLDVPSEGGAPVDAGNCGGDDGMDGVETGEPSASDDAADGLEEDDEGITGEGYNFERCGTDSDCVNPRRCFNPVSYKLCVSTDDNCVCVASDNSLCTASAEDCLRGDRCASAADQENGLCVSCGFEEDALDLAYVDGGAFVDAGNCASNAPTDAPTITPASSNPPTAVASPTPTPTPTPTVSVDPPAEAPTSSPSQTARVSRSPQPSVPTAGPATASPSSELPSATPDVTLQPPGTPGEGESPVESETADADADAGVCISVDMLSGHPQSSLVYATHRRAAVLCDQFRNCATPAHIVLFDDVPLSMSEYCAQSDVACDARVALVNSPKMKVGLRIASRSRRLRFSALAATKETWLEVRLLKLVVAAGI